MAGALRRVVRWARLALVPMACLAGPPAQALPLEGFGADTPGGLLGSPYVVTSLADAGPGTLREAVSDSNRYVVFAVAGTISVESTIDVRGSFVTIDGFAAPPPGITVTAAHAGVPNALFRIAGVHDVIVHNIRFRDAPDPSIGDTFRIGAGASRVVVDHCSFRRAGDGALDISDGANNLTVQWSIFADTVKNQLVRSGVHNLSLHHNLYVRGWERNPQIDAAGPVDIVNNVIADWGTNYGTRIRGGSSANLVANYYLPSGRSDRENAVVITPDSTVFSRNNRVPAEANDSGTTTERIPAPPVLELPPETALLAVLLFSGAQPRDVEDWGYALTALGTLVP